MTFTNLRIFFFEFQSHIYSSLSLLGFFCVFSLFYIGVEFYIKTRIVPLVAIRKVVTAAINKEMGKAVDLGVVEFNFREGIILEDLIISQEEDFSFNAHLLEVKKVTFHITSYFATVPEVDRIEFFSPHLILGNDENIEKKLLDYFHKTKIKEVILHNMRISLKKGNMSVLEWKEGWDIHIIRRKGKVIITYDNGIYWLPNVTRIKGEGMLSEGNIDDFNFTLVWKNYASEEAPFLVSYLFGLPIQSAVLSGTGSWERNANMGDIVKGEVEFENANFFLPNINSYLMSGIRFQEKFFFQKNKETREFASPNFQIRMEDEIIPGKEINFKKKVDFEVEDIGSVATHFRELATGEGIALTGKIRGNFEILETGEKNKWFKLIGAISAEEFDWKSDLFSLRNGSALINITDGNNLSLKLKGDVFDKPVTFDVASQLDWTRGKKTDGSFYYPMTSKSKGSLSLAELTASQWRPMYDSWKKDTLAEIKERQEKLIPEEYFYQKKIYKYFLESLNIDLNFRINNFIPFEGGPHLHGAKGSLIVKEGRLNTILGLENSDSKVTMGSYYATKTPNFQFAMLLNQYPWNGPWMEVCGMSLNPEKVTLNYSFGSQGSDYYTLSKDARINYYMKLENTKWIGNDLWSKVNITEKTKDAMFTLEFELDHYFDSDYVRNLSVSSESVDLKGYAQNRSGFFSYSVYGLLGADRSSWVLTEDESKRCSFK